VSLAYIYGNIFGLYFLKYIVQHLGGRLVRGRPRKKYLFLGRATDRGFGAADCVSPEPT